VETLPCGSTVGATPIPYVKYSCAVWLFSLNGHFARPTKIRLPPDIQGFTVASRDSGVPLEWGKAKISIPHSEYLLFGWDDPEQSDNLLSMKHALGKAHLPAGYTGPVDDEGNALLGGEQQFTADWLEIFHVSDT